MRLVLLTCCKSTWNAKNLYPKDQLIVLKWMWLPGHKITITVGVQSYQTPSVGTFMQRPELTSKEDLARTSYEELKESTAARVAAQEVVERHVW